MTDDLRYLDDWRAMAIEERELWKRFQAHEMTVEEFTDARLACNKKHNFIRCANGGYKHKTFVGYEYACSVYEKE